MCKKRQMRSTSCYLQIRRRPGMQIQKWREKRAPRRWEGALLANRKKFADKMQKAPEPEKGAGALKDWWPGAQ